MPCHRLSGDLQSHMTRHGCSTQDAAGCMTHPLPNRALQSNVPRGVQPELDLSRFSAAPRARLSHLSFESDRAFPAQC